MFDPILFSGRSIYYPLKLEHISSQSPYKINMVEIFVTYGLCDLLAAGRTHIHMTNLICFN